MKNSLLKCENYNTKFNYFSLLKPFWIGLKKVECRKCHSIYDSNTLYTKMEELTIIAPKYFEVVNSINTVWVALCAALNFLWRLDLLF